LTKGRFHQHFRLTFTSEQDEKLILANSAHIWQTAHIFVEFSRDFSLKSGDVPDESPNIITVAHDAHQAVRKGLHYVLELKYPIKYVKNYQVKFFLTLYMC